MQIKNGMYQQFADAIMSALSSKPPEQHIPLQQSMFAYSIQCLCRIAYGKLFDDEAEVKRLEQLYKSVSSTCVFLKMVRSGIMNR